MLDILFATAAMAQEAGGGDAAAQGGIAGILSGPLPMLVLMFVIFYFLLIRPQQKKTKAHKEMLAQIKKGDSVVTSGGIHGKVTGVADQTLVIEIAPQVRVKVQRASVAGLAGAAQAPAADNKAKGKK